MYVVRVLRVVAVVVVAGSSSSLCGMSSDVCSLPTAEQLREIIHAVIDWYTAHTSFMLCIVTL
jgi:hypothetical protein